MRRKKCSSCRHDLQSTFQGKLYPIIQQVVAEKGIEILFSQRDSGIVFANPALDLTADVIKRFDAAQAAAAPPPPAPAPRRRPAKPQIAVTGSQVHRFTVRVQQARRFAGPGSARTCEPWTLCDPAACEP